MVTGSGIRIDRCICAGRLFEELVAIAKERGLSVDELAGCTGASAGCGMCRPYVEKALATGQVVFTELLVEGKG
ncbi:hypothetical protein [Mucisphaera sp.]|uniref:hypothetical protein n=1 Tax=Mucisphaera sp. TaxID=2913024 RepID=UPI003D0E72DF